MNRPSLVAAGSAGAAETAAVLLQAGGNAFDAAVGAVYASMISEPALTGLAGGGQLMAFGNGQACLYDFFVDVPLRVPRRDLDFFPVTVDFGTATQDFHIGRGSVAVPGTAAGLAAVHQDLGRASFEDVLAPAVELARQGVALSGVQARFIELLRPILTREESGRRLFAPRRRPIREGEVFRNPELAQTLELLARRGSALFYEGEIGRELARWAPQGGLITADDLKRYRVRRRRPLTVDWAGVTLLCSPPPAKSGPQIQEILRRLPADGGRELAHLLAAMAPSRPRASSTTGSTTHVSVLDGDGNAASVTTTNGEGCGYLIAGTGVMPNNMLGEEDLNPDGFHQGPRGQRLSTAMAPTIGVRAGEPVLLTGSSGSERIRSAILQVMWRHLVGGASIDEATTAPRAHLEGRTLHLEPGLDAGLLAALDEPFRVRHWPRKSVFFGGVNSVTPDRAVADPRRDGCALVVG